MLEIKNVYKDVYKRQTQQWVQFDSPLPAYFTEFLTRLRKEHRA